MISGHPALNQQVTFLYSEDVEASWRFYSEILGLPLIQDQGTCRIYEAAPGGRAFLGICRAKAPRATMDPRVEGGVVITFIADDVDCWYEYLKARGVEIPYPPAFNEFYRVYHFFFQDPAGYMLEIQRFERPDWVDPPC
jgi:catechol 2,3-dioxygenase-like lactoylglutathione lyase family enzyme